MKLKFLRQQMDKSQQTVALELDIPRTKYARYEIGESNPTIDTLIKMADYFNVSLDYLCDRPFNNNIGHVPEERKGTIKDLLSLTENEFKEVSAFIKGFKIGKNQDEDFQIFNRRKEND